MDTKHIFQLATQYQHDPEQLHASLLNCVPVDPQRPLAMGWPSSRVCVQLLEIALADYNAPDQRLVLATAMTELLNWRTLRAAAAVDKPHTQTAAFKDCVRAALGPVVAVRGDGNCFYRAVVKTLFAPVTLPDELEDALALFLREQINPAAAVADAAAAAGVEGAVERGVNDAETMARSGTWADSVQIFKAANYLRCPIFVVTSADRELMFDVVHGMLLPSDSFRILPRCRPDDDQPGGPGRAVDTPLFIHYDPYGHYEAIVPKALAARYRQMTTTLDALLETTESLAGARPPTEDFIKAACWTYAMLATKLDSAKQSFSSEKTQQLHEVKRGIRRLANALSRASAQDTQRIAPAVLRLHMTLLSSMFLDNLMFIDGEDEPVAVGDGRLSELYKLLKKALPGHTPTYQQAPTAWQSTTSSSRQLQAYDGRMYAQQPPAKLSQSQQCPQLRPVTTLPQLAPVTSLPPTQQHFAAASANVAPQNRLVAAEHTDAGMWERSYRVPGNIVQFTNTTVRTQSLVGFVGFVRSTRVKYIEFNYCTFEDDSKEALESLAALPNITRVSLTNCNHAPCFSNPKITVR